jgi:hypothetical protein
MIQGSVVGNKIQEEAQSPRVKPVTETRERSVPAEIGMHRVSRYRKTRAADIGVVQVGKKLQVLPPPLRVVERYLPSCLSGLPDAEKPHPIEPQACQTIQF